MEWKPKKVVIENVPVVEKEEKKPEEK